MKKIITALGSCIVCLVDVHTLHKENYGDEKIRQEHISSTISNQNTTTKTGFGPFFVSSNNEDEDENEDEMDVARNVLPTIMVPVPSSIVSSSPSVMNCSSSHQYVPEKQTLKSAFGLCCEAIDSVWHIRTGTIDHVMGNTYNILWKLREIVNSLSANIIGQESADVIFSNIVNNLHLLEKAHTPPELYPATPHSECSNKSEAESDSTNEDESENAEKESESAEIDMYDIDSVPKIIKMTIDGIKDVAKIFSPVPEETEEWKNCQKESLKKTKVQEARHTSSSSSSALPTSSSMSPFFPSHMVLAVSSSAPLLPSDAGLLHLNYEGYWDNQEFNMQIFQHSKAYKRQKIREKNRFQKRNKK
ncbi:MAG: hypothetical protein LBT70_00075 [Holosporaceae bacterium]|jgi:hypothetical protein|nr:hypothetical protein [Holosporaceae bacterium]